MEGGLPTDLPKTVPKRMRGGERAAGPTGKLLLMPQDPNSVFIMVATGTGIAPFRAFWRRQFFEDIPNYKFTGLSWLFMGVANSDAKLYDDELQEILATYPDQVRAASRCPLLRDGLHRAWQSRPRKCRCQEVSALPGVGRRK